MILKSNKCSILNKKAKLYFLYKQNNENLVIYKKFDGHSINDYLTNYWPLDNNFTDVASGSDIIGGINYNFTLDRFNNSLSAVYLNDGYLQVPNNLKYFYGEFTIMIWIKIISHTTSSRIINFGGTYDSVCLGISDFLTGKPWFV